MISEAEALYKTLGSIYCPAIKQDVVFGHHGENHLFFDGHGHRRNEQNIRRRLYLLPLAPNIVKNGKPVKLKETRTIRVRGNIREADFYEIGLSCLNGKFTEFAVVIVRKFPIGPFHYYSIRSKHKRRRK